MSQIWPVFDEEQISAVEQVLRSGRVNAWTGPDVNSFEQEYRAYTGSSHAIAMANGTVTLDAALQVLDLQPCDEVIVTPRSFIASVSTVLMAGATPVFADVDRDTQNLSPETIAAVLTEKTRGIILVHLAGWPADMPAIMELAKAHNLWVIEDCAQAHGAMIGDRHVGTFGTFGSFSFCQDKIISTGGEGGLLVTDDDDLWSRAWSYKDHGKSYDQVHRKDHPPGFRWVHSAEPGTNLRMTGMSAAIGRVQLKRLDGWRQHRTENATILANALAACPAFRVPTPPEDLTHAYYRFYAFVEPQALSASWSRDRIIAEVSEAGFPIFSGSCSEIYREGVFERYGLTPDKPLPVAQELGQTSLAFLVDPTWSPDRTHQLAETVVKFGDAALRQSVNA